MHAPSGRKPISTSLKRLGPGVRSPRHVRIARLALSAVLAIPLATACASGSESLPEASTPRSASAAPLAAGSPACQSAAASPLLGSGKSPEAGAKAAALSSPNLLQQLHDYYRSISTAAQMDGLTQVVLDADAVAASIDKMRSDMMAGVARTQLDWQTLSSSLSKLQTTCST